MKKAWFSPILVDVVEHEDGTMEAVDVYDAGGYMVKQNVLNAIIDFCKRSKKKYSDEYVDMRNQLSYNESITPKQKKPKEERPPKPCTVYVIRDTIRGFYKIGKAINLESRLAQLRTANQCIELIANYPGSHRDEKDLHNIFYVRGKHAEDLLKLTPMALVIQTFRSALLEEEDKDNLDKPLLKTLLKFKKNFISDNEVFFFSNRQSIPEIEITKNDFKKIEYLDDSIPEPKKIIINGQLDEMKVSKNKLGLVTQDGFVNIFANDNTIIQGIVDYMGKDVTISGMAHFKPNGQLSYIEIQEYFEPGQKDSFYSRKPVSMNIEQQLLFQIKQGKKRNPLSAITGKWPGDESFDDLIKMLE